MRNWLARLIILLLPVVTNVYAEKVKYLVVSNYSKTFLYFTVINLLNVEVEPTGHTTDLRYLPPGERKLVKIKINSDESAVQIFTFTANGSPAEKENLMPICEVSAAQKTDTSLPYADASILPNYDAKLQCSIKDSMALVINE